ncbi:hypothetical protein Mapa_017802 [Marchantia paleacea]|nr:hypothetical protein Mapa_017802 [Marchantia paleacea]
MIRAQVVAYENRNRTMYKTLNGGVSLLRSFLIHIENLETDRFCCAMSTISVPAMRGRVGRLVVRWRRRSARGVVRRGRRSMGHMGHVRWGRGRVCIVGSRLVGKVRRRWRLVR